MIEEKQLYWNRMLVEVIKHYYFNKSKSANKKSSTSFFWGVWQQQGLYRYM